jgi:hypothetical protein
LAHIRDTISAVRPEGNLDGPRQHEFWARLSARKPAGLASSSCKNPARGDVLRILPIVLVALVPSIALTAQTPLPPDINPVTERKALLPALTR